MTTKILTGDYGSYDLTSPITTLSIAASGYITAGLTSAGVNTYTIVNKGHVRGVYYGVSLAGGGAITNAETIKSTSTIKGGGLVLGNGGNVTNAAGAVISGYSGLSIGAEAGTVNNQGLILGTLSDAVDLADGGVVTNGAAANASAVIRGSTGVMAILGATVHNYGTVIGGGTVGVGAYLKSGGLVTNGSATDKAATLQGTSAGVAFAGATGTLTNFGLVRGTGTTSIGVAFEDGGTVTNGSASDLGATIEADQFGVQATVVAAGVINYGTIRGDGGTAGGGGVALESGGTIINGTTLDTTASIQGSELGAAIIGQAGTVNNFGTIVGGYASGGLSGIGVYLGDGGSVTNGGAKDATARIGAQVGIYLKGAVGTVTNFATIGGAGTEIGAAVTYGGMLINGSSIDTSALIQGYVGVAGETHTVTVVNFGTIAAGNGTGTVTSSESDAVILLGGGAVTNGSSTDTKALLLGTVGVVAETIVSTVSNFGDIVGSLAGVYFSNGGRVTNGTAADTGANIVGSVAGVLFTNAAGTVSNFGTIVGGIGSNATYSGVTLQAGGSVTNGSSTDHTALIHGQVGVSSGAVAKITNNGTISGSAFVSGYGVVLYEGSTLTNDVGALVDAYTGVTAEVGATVTNFGAIQATGGKTVVLFSATSRLNAEAGSVFEGVIEADFGLVDIVGGVVSASGIDSSGKIEGAGTLSLTTGASFLSSGVGLTVSKIMVGSGETVNVNTKLVDSRIWDQTAGTLSINGGDQMTFTGSGNSFTGAVQGGGTFFLDGGSDTFANVALTATKLVISKAAVTLSGEVTVNGVISVTSPTLVVAAAGAVLNGGGEWLLSNTATNSIHGANAAATLANVSDTIKGSGKLGGGIMTLINDTAGIIESSGSVGLTIDTGAKTITNAGVIEALTGGGIIVSSAVNNTGTLMAFNGTLTVNGAVTGAGIVKVVGGVADFTGAFNEKVEFGASGRLVLAHSQTYGGTIAGFSHTGTTSMDLADIAFSGATTATYSGTATAGVLTVSDGTHTANIHLSGNYLTASWELSAATGGGTHVIDPTAPKPAAAPLIAAMASFGASHAGSTPSTLPTPITAMAMLAGPVAQFHGNQP